MLLGFAYSTAEEVSYPSLLIPKVILINIKLRIYILFLTLELGVSTVV